MKEKDKEKRNGSSPDRKTEKKLSFAQVWKEKRFRSIILSAGLVLLAVVVYVVLLQTVLKPEQQTELPTVGNHGEQMANGRPFVIDPIEPNQLDSVRVENDLGGFYLYRGQDNEFYFEGAEFILYDVTSAWMDGSENMEDVMQSVSMVDSLLSLCRYMLALEEVVGYDPNNLASYGLEGRGQAALTIGHRNNSDQSVSDTIIFGNRTVDGSGYYARLEGRDAVYVLMDIYISRCIFADLKAYFSPMVAPTVPSSSYTEVSKFTIKKQGKEFLSMRSMSEEEREKNGKLFSHMFLSPAGYFASSENMQTLLESFVAFKGKQVVEYGIASRLSKPENADEIREMLRLYSLMDPEDRWYFELYYSYEDRFDITLYISNKLEVESEENEGEKEHIYYIYSPDFDVIVEFSADDLPWVEWDLLKYLDNHSFSGSIDSVSFIELSYGETKVKFSLQGTGSDLKISSSTGVSVDTDNFRQLYKAILYTTMDGYAQEPQNATHILSLKITLRNGTQYDYQFYGMTARKAYYTLNGSGEFYINRDYVKQIVSACTGILNGETVVVEKKN